MLEKAGIYSNSKVKSAVELISVDETVPYHMVIVTLKDQKDTKAIAQEMVNNINIKQWDDVEKLNAGVFGVHGEITMIVLDERLFDDFYPTFVEWCNIDVKTYVDYIEARTSGLYEPSNWTYFSWKLSD